MALLIVLPICAFLYPVVRLDSPGAFFFRQQRMGLNGKLFRIFKIRTMQQGSENGTGVTCNGDPRVTAVGRLLRKSKLDELPQFINVWLGDMSVVGPRPDLPQYKNVSPEKWKRILSVRPGITDGVSLKYFDVEDDIPNDGSAEDFYRNKFLPKKQKLYLNYLQNQSLANDIGIIVKTLNRWIFN
jgi:lipopolysaccharide/colanic/teichoic acid biosynthesis glycosyltransferase